MSQQPAPLTNPKLTLTLCRIIWAALCAGVTVFLVVISILATSTDKPATHLNGLSPDLLFGFALGFLVTAYPLGLFIRGQVFKKGWVGDVVQPGAYLAGNIVAWALCEGAAMFGIVVVMLTRRLWPDLLAPIAALLLLLLLWPNGRAMFPRKEKW